MRMGYGSLKKFAALLAIGCTGCTARVGVDENATCHALHLLLKAWRYDFNGLIKICGCTSPHPDAFGFSQ